MKLPSESRSSAMKLSLDPKIQLSIELSSCESNPGISQIFTAVFTWKAVGGNSRNGDEFSGRKSRLARMALFWFYLFMILI